MSREWQLFFGGAICGGLATHLIWYITALTIWSKK